MAKEDWRMLGYVAARAVKDIGTRAAAHGVKSIFKDLDRTAGHVKKHINRAIDKLEEMTSVEEPVDDEDTRG